MLELLDLPMDILLHITKLVVAIDNDTALVALNGVHYIQEPDLFLRLACQRLNKLCKDSHRDAWLPVKIISSVPRSMCFYNVVPVFTTDAVRMQQMEWELGAIPQVSISARARSADGKKQPSETSIAIISLHHATAYFGFLHSRQAASVPHKGRLQVSDDACHLSLSISLKVEEQFLRSMSQEYLDDPSRKQLLFASLSKMRHPDNRLLGMIPDSFNDPIEWAQCRRADIYALRREREALYQLLLHSGGDALGRHDYIHQRLLDLTACYFEFIRTSIVTGACSSSELQAFLNELLRLAYDLKIISVKTFVDADPTWPPRVLPRCDDCDDDTPCCDVLLWELGQTHAKLDSRIGLYWAAKKAVDHNMRCDGDILIHLERAYEDLKEAVVAIEQRFGTRLASADRQLKLIRQLCNEIRTRDRLKEQKKLEYRAPRFVWTAEEDQTWGEDDVCCLVRARLGAGEELLYVQSSNEAMDEGVL